MLNNEAQTPQRSDKFFVWYINGCTSGLADIGQAKTKFELLTVEEQQSLRTEFDNNLRRISEEGSGWTAPFAG